MEKLPSESTPKENSWEKEALPSVMNLQTWKLKRFRQQKLLKKVHSIKTEQNKRYFKPIQLSLIV